MKNRRSVLIFGLVGFVVLVGLVVWWWGNTPAPTVPLPELPKVEITPAVPQPGVQSYTLRASLPRVETLSVYKYEYTCSGSVCKARPFEWARSLGFGGEPQELEDALEGTLLLWSKEGETLVIAADGSNLSYRVDLKADPRTPSGSFLPTFEAAAEIVERTLSELGSAGGGLEYEPQKSQALKTGVEYVQKTTFDQAELVEVHFIAKIGDYPLYLDSGPEQDPVLAWVGRDGKLLRLEYYPVGTLGEKIANYPVKDEKELLKGLEGGKGVVVSSNLEGGEEIVSTTIARATLGYLLPQPNATTIQPIFVLTGQARAASGKTGTVTVYLPAVD